MTHDPSSAPPAPTPPLTDPYETLQQAAEQQRAGRLAEAQRLYQLVLQSYPDDPFAHHNLGVLAMQRGDPLEQALRHFKAAWDGDPSHAQHGLNYIKALIRAGQREDASRVHAEGSRRGLQWPSMDVLEARSGTGATPPRAAPNGAQRRGGTAPDKAERDAVIGLFRQGDFAGVEVLARNMTSRYPQNGFGWKALGLAIQKQGRPADALAPTETAVRLQPEDPETHNNLGSVLFDIDLRHEAEGAFRRAVALKPDFAGAHCNLGKVLWTLNRFQEAEAAYRRAIAVRANYAEAYCGLGNALRDLDRYDEAIGAYEQAVAINPDHMAARLDLVDSLIIQQRLGKAEEAVRQGLERNPDLLELQHVLADVFARQGRLADADACHRKAVALGPDDLVARSGLLFFSNYNAHVSPEAQREQALAYGELARQRVHQAFSDWTCPPAPERLRVGLVSGDLCQHPVGFFIESVLAHADSERVEWIAYPTIVRTDPVSVRLRSSVSSWRPLAGLTDELAARRIHEDGVHVLIDLAGHTAHSGLSMFAWRPAPVQVSWLGYFATTGLAEMDYFLADEVGVPPSQRDHFMEKVWYLPDTRLCFTPPDTDEMPAPLPALRRGFVTFGCFQAPAKINDEVLRTWGRILAGCPGSRLRIQNGWALSDAHTATELRARLTGQGVDPDRVDLHGHVRRREYLGAYADVDIVLDTFPYNGGTTTCEALWMGVPTLTLAGETLIARQGASILTAAGLPDWVTQTREEYVDRALALAGDVPGLTALRNGLRERVRASALFDAPRFVRNLEDALWAMWRARD